jgi:hypothetical protein
MPLLTTEAAKLSQEDMRRGVIEEFYDRDGLFGMLDWQKTDGKAYVYNREKTLAEGAWLDPNETVPESASTFESVTTTLKINIGDVDVDKFLDSTQSDINSQKAIQIASKAKGMSRAFRKLLVTGDEATSPKEFNGVNKLVHADQQIIAGTNGNAIDLSMLDELVDAVETGAHALLMRSGTYRAYKAQLRLMGGADPVQMMIKDFGYVPSHDGTPILINDFIPGNVTQGTSTETCSIYALNFDPAVGFHAIYGGEAAGFSLEDIGTVQNKDATRTRIKQYVGTALKSTKSLAAIRGVTSI